MRILTGKLKGRQIKVPKGNITRPTSGRIKKSIFDTIGPFDSDTIALDIFSGSGGMGIEALSRGAKQVTFIEQNRKVAKILKENLNNCRLEEKADIIELDYKKALSVLKKNNSKFDIIFIDPPYSIYNEEESVENLVLLSQNVLKNDGTIIIEHNTINDINLDPFETKTKKYGETMISFLWRKN